MAMILFQGYITEEHSEHLERISKETGEAKAALLRKMIDLDMGKVKVEAEQESHAFCEECGDWVNVKDARCVECGAELD